MTVGLLLTSITNAIEAVSITNVTVMDKDEVSASFAPKPYVLYPNPEGFVTGFGIQYDSIKEGAGAAMTIRYTLNYRFLGTPIGTAESFTAAYSDLIDKVVTVVNALIATDSPYDGRVRMKLASVEFGGREDPSGNQYHGADIALEIEEMQN